MASQVRSRPPAGPSKPPAPLQKPAAIPQKTGLPTVDLVKSFVANQSDEEVSGGWRNVWLAAGACFVVFMTATSVMDGLQSPKSAELNRQYYAQVPKFIYQFSCAAFATAVLTNCLSFVYEVSPLKRQAAVIQILIKGISLWGDFHMGYRDPLMVLDTHGAVMIPIRFVHWSVSCPLIVWLAARISTDSHTQVLSALVTSVTTILCGFSATLIPWPWRWIVWCTALVSHSNTMRRMDAMLRSVENEAVNEDSRRGLRSIRISTLVLWNVFPLTDFLKETRWVSRASLEVFIAFANFYAKVIFSSSIMYANFVSAAERRAIREELDKQLSRVNLVEELQRALETKEEFMSMVSHELRTPLNGLIGLSEAMLEDGPWQLGELGLRYMRTIKTSSIHLAALINDILDQAAAAKGSLAIKLERAHLDRIVSDVMEISAQLVKKNVKLVHYVDPATPVIVADKKRLTQILYNLMGNALKFTHQGSVVVNVKPAVSGTEVIISVSDTGCGIPPDKHHAIFEPFNQGDQSTTRKYGGTGLGLSIVGRLVAAHNGQISVSSAVGKGSTFIIRLPIHQPNESQCPSALDSINASARASIDLSKGHQEHAAEKNPQKAVSVISVKTSFAKAPASLQAVVGANDRPATADYDMRSQREPAARVLHSSASKSTKESTVFMDRSARLEPIDSPRASVDETEFSKDRDARIAAAATLLVPHQNVSKPKKVASKVWARQSSRGETEGRRSSLSLTELSRPGGRPASFSGGIVRLGSLKPTYSELHGEALILSIDDEPTNQMVIGEIIRSQGYLIHQEMDGRAALDWLAEQSELPDLILLDCMMPGLSGHDVCKELRRAVPASLVPVIMLSAKNSEENVVESLQNGCNDFVSKPIKRAELVARIAAHLRIKADATWVNSLVNGAMKDDAEAMKILKSILPEGIITRIQEGQRIIGDSHPHVVILFSDIVGFSTLAMDLPAIEVFMLLTNLYAAFDKLVDKHGVYKVETIGDGYMIAAGHDENAATAKLGRPVERMIKMAKGMLEVVRTFKMPRGVPLQIRIGIHCGPAFAGVIGSKCPRYCFLGDCVNTASRMESTSFPMTVQVSQAVYDDAATPDAFSPLGLRAIKGKGKMITHLLKAGEWAAARDACMAAPEGELTPPATRSLALGQAALGTSFKQHVDSGTGKPLSVAAANSLQQQLQELQQRLKEEKDGRQGDALQIAELSAQLSDALSALQSATATSPAEPLLKLQAQLNAAQAALERERLTHAGDATIIAALQERLSGALTTAQQIAEHHSKAMLMHDCSFPLIPVEQVWSISAASSALSSLSQVVRIQQGAVSKIMVVSAGYSINQLLQDVGLQVYQGAFDEHHVRLETLQAMGHEDLRDLGVLSVGHRRSIIVALQNYTRSYLQIYLRSCDMAALQLQASL